MNISKARPAMNPVSFRALGCLGFKPADPVWVSSGYELLVPFIFLTDCSRWTAFLVISIQRLIPFFFSSWQITINLILLSSIIGCQLTAPWSVSRIFNYVNLLFSKKKKNIQGPLSFLSVQEAEHQNIIIYRWSMDNNSRMDLFNDAIFIKSSTCGFLHFRFSTFPFARGIEHTILVAGWGSFHFQIKRARTF